MPDVIIVNDNASFTSSTTFSTQDSEQSPRPLRRRNTVTQLTRRVSKRISQSILRVGVQEHQLSEKNLKDLNEATHVDALGSPGSYLPDQSHEPKVYEPIHEDIEEEVHSVDVEAARDMRLQESYAAFCRDFTMSGKPTVNRKFDLNMRMEEASEVHQQPRSICSINGYVLLYAQQSNVAFHDSENDARKEYRFGTMNFPHGFCSNCGSSMYARADGGKYGGIMAINARTLKGIDISTLKIEQVDGKNVEFS
ncbi:hypothetical protein PENARI_c018G03563 [Penicillium arizonense]|uniref:CENP-V/GFA domain-containing protein n=1 Tax=Penicillium arizonense TaxID=1835702 RepID=A0A1F5LAW9_PENAI|nr:hypothetical protein PENARI_c018G03563 [Penicillium arizonense]OGE50206.1 hypothetical protein PENARI_c018G03563 [Penicillium arizonense]